MGLSYAEIAGELSLSKSWVIRLIQDHTSPEDFDVNCPRGASPYGFARIRGGRLLRDPRETTVVLQIIRYDQMGWSKTKIAQVLDKKKIRPRSGKTWDHSTIRSVLERNRSSLKEIENFLSES